MDSDCRWNIIAASVDDRTREERGLEVSGVGGVEGGEGCGGGGGLKLARKTVRFFSRDYS